MAAEGRDKRFRAYRKGHRGEWLAAFALLLRGYRIVARRHRTKLGEIDLIARRGDLVAIVEVKARPTLIQAMDAVGHEAQRRIEGDPHRANHVSGGEHVRLRLVQRRDHRR